MEDRICPAVFLECTGNEGRGATARGAALSKESRTTAKLHVLHAVHKRLQLA